MDGNNTTHFYSFGVEYISKEIKKKLIVGRNSEANVYWIETYFQPIRDVLGTSPKGYRKSRTSRGPSKNS